MAHQAGRILGSRQLIKINKPSFSVFSLLILSASLITSAASAAQTGASSASNQAGVSQSRPAARKVMAANSSFGSAVSTPSHALATTPSRVAVPSRSSVRSSGRPSSRASVQGSGGSSSTQNASAFSVASNLSLPPESALELTLDETESPKPKKKTEIKWRTRVSGQHYQNSQELTQWASLLLQANATRRVSDAVLFKANLFASLKSSYAQSKYGEYQPRSAVGAFEGYIEAKPWEPLALQAGILDQDKMNAPLILDQIPWPGLVQKLEIGEEYSVEFKAEQAIPTASDLSTQATSAESTPAFTMETLSVAAEPKDGLVHVKAWGGHYAFHNLASRAAADSDIGGNTLIEVDGKTRFRYEFEGWLAGGEAKLNFNEGFSWKFSGQVAQNLQAPENFRNGQMLGTGLSITLPGNIILEPEGAIYFAESDLGPSVYNSAEQGHNNREGWIASFDTTFKNQGFRMGAILYDSSPINPHPIQVRQQFLLLKFETLYELL